MNARNRPIVHLACLLYTSLFDELVKVMPDGTYLSSVKETGNKLKLEGVAQSSTRVSTLMRNIAASQWPVSYTHLDVYKRQTYA